MEANACLVEANAWHHDMSAATEENLMSPPHGSNMRKVQGEPEDLVQCSQLHEIDIELLEARNHATTKKQSHLNI